MHPQKKLTQLEFRQGVAKGLLVDHESTEVRHRAHDPCLPLRLKERAFPEPIPDKSSRLSGPQQQSCWSQAPDTIQLQTLQDTPLPLSLFWKVSLINCK